VINIYYPKNLINILRKSKNPFIPRKLPDKFKQLKVHRKYYASEFASASYFKVIDSFETEQETYVVLLFVDDLYWTIPSKLNNMLDIYELIYDKYNLLGKNIINSGSSYYGYEIKYWFFNKNNNKFNKFKVYLEDNGKYKIDESDKYFITANIGKNGKYINVKMIRDDKDGLG
jgi:hypothetical protein